MDYLCWSMEYYNTAADIADVIERLKAERKSASVSEKKELDTKLSQYKIYYGECMHIADLLMKRYEGVA